jgi:S-adenosylmethionine decarboxylase proenzyme
LAFWGADLRGRRCLLGRSRSGAARAIGSFGFSHRRRGKPSLQPLTQGFEYEIAPRSLRQDDQRTLGTHLLVELYGCNAKTLERVAYVENALVRAAHESNAHIVSHFFHEFEPYGVSGVVVIEESHYTIHTWPERRYAAVDLFFCSETVDAERALEVLRGAFEPEHVDVMLIRRGVLERAPG